MKQLRMKNHYVKQNANMEIVFNFQMTLQNIFVIAMKDMIHILMIVQKDVIISKNLN